MAKILRKDRLNEMISRLASRNTAVFGPSPEADGAISQFRLMQTSDEIDLERVLTRLSVKSLFFPRTEPMMRFDIAKQSIDMQQILPDEQKRVVFGCRPCDAASLAMLDGLFNWDYADAFWNRRRENTTIVSIACTRKDDFCMCTSLDLAPDSSFGSDVLLKAASDGAGWQVEAISDKGRRFVESLGDLLVEQNPPELAATTVVEKKFDVAKVCEWAAQDENFESDLWSQMSERCLGCGVCTYMCPTCHCFDIQDEGNAYRGVRRKNWDSCSFSLFTLHTSGHNPRPTQASRWRQRIMHKFNYYPSKFQHRSCTGCGRCTRYCPVDMGVAETLQAIGR